MTLIDKLKAARRAAVPIVAITTPDPAATQQQICGELTGDQDIPKLSWDLVRGYHALNKEGAVALTTDMGAEEQAAEGDPVEALKLALQLPESAILVFLNGQRFIKDAAVMQAVWNLRDEFKRDARTLVLLGPDFELPPELQTDVVEFDEPLPDEARLRDIVSGIFGHAEDQLQFEITPELVGSVAASLKGCSAFAAEQLVAMALRKDRVDVEHLNTQARKLIEQTPGLTFERGEETFADIGGLDFAKEFGKRIFAGPRRPDVVVRIEELEKAMAGSTGGDLSGTSSDALQVLLSALEDNNWNGLLAAGPAGGGKSLYAKSLANTHGAKAIRFDINATKGSLVGESSRKIRAAMKVLHTIGGERVFFVASVNRLDSVPPELQRRFRAGTWFFDIPTADEAKEIWKINRARYGIDAKDTEPKLADLTGADIRNICEMSFALSCPLKEALDYVVPLKTQSPGSIKEARDYADGRFISAANGGVYKRSKAGTLKANARTVRI